MALVIGAASAAMGATGGNFILGKANGADRASKLTASLTGPALALVNNSTESAATALNISVAEGKAPLKANAEAGTATNLSADELDGKDSSEFLAADGKAQAAVHADQADSATNATKLGGVAAGDYQRKCQKGAVTGHVVVNDPSTLPNSWTEVNSKYISSYNCTGEPIRIIRYGAGRYAVEFDGQEYMGRTAVTSVESGYGRNDAFANTSFVFHYGDGRIARDVNIRTHDGTYVDSSLQLVAFD